MPGLVALEQPRGSKFKDRRLHRVERGKHPCDRARPGIGTVRKQARMALGDMEHDRPCLEQGEVAFLIGPKLPERMKRQMRGFLPRAKRNKANLVVCTLILKRLVNAPITYQHLCPILL